MVDDHAVTFDEVKRIDASRGDRPFLRGPARRRRFPSSRGQLFSRGRTAGTT